MPKFSAARSITIETDPNSVFDKVADYGTWTTWSPWLCAEPDAEVKISADSNSVGSTYAWDGKIVGSGELEHKVLEPGRLIDDEIRFLKPFKSQSEVKFEFEKVADGTKVTWHMNGKLPWFMFWMKPMMEPFIGMDYERGLKMLKEWIETGNINSKTITKGIQTVGPLRMAGIKKTSHMKEMSKEMPVALEDAKRKLDQHGVEIQGCISVYHKFNIKQQIMDYTTGFIVNETVDIPGLNDWKIDNVRALRVDHVGSYQHLGNAWSAANQISRYEKLKQSKVGTFEIYRNDPTEVPEEEILTEIYLPLK